MYVAPEAHDLLPKEAFRSTLENKKYATRHFQYSEQGSYCGTTREGHGASVFQMNSWSLYSTDYDAESRHVLPDDPAFEVTRSAISGEIEDEGPVRALQDLTSTVNSDHLVSSAATMIQVTP